MNLSAIKRRYTLPHRLSDVIRLISVLSMDASTFRSEKSLNHSLRSEPLSHESKEWKMIIKDHPEFFRSNGKDDHFALIIRSYFPENPQDENGTIRLRNRLTVAETQKLIDVAINLHDKEVARIESKSRWFPIIVACIALIGPIYSTVNNNNINNDVSKKIDALTSVIYKLRAGDQSKHISK